MTFKKLVLWSLLGGICTAGLEFKLGRAPLVRVWDGWGFTRLPGSTKCAFGFSQIKKKKSIYSMTCCPQELFFSLKKSSRPWETVDIKTSWYIFLLDWYSKLTWFELSYNRLKNLKSKYYDWHEQCFRLNINFKMIWFFINYWDEDMLDRSRFYGLTYRTYDLDHGQNTKLNFF